MAQVDGDEGRRPGHHHPVRVHAGPVGGQADAEVGGDGEQAQPEDIAQQKRGSGQDVARMDKNFR